MKKIYFIEGLPGSGKTTFSRKLSKYLTDKHIPNMIYNEGDLHPVDLAWITCPKEEEMDKLLNRFSSIKDEIQKQSKKIGDTYYIAYTKVKISHDTKDFYSYCKQFEVYKTEDLNYFLSKHLELWELFIEQTENNDITYIFECIFLQNHINELILKHNLDEQMITQYFNKFSEVFQKCDVELFYINQIDVDKTIDTIVNQRRTNDKTLYKDWIDNVIEYFENSKYGKTLGYIGYDGAIKYFHDRKNIELSLLKNMNIKSHIIDLDDNYEEVFEQIKRLL